METNTDGTRLTNKAIHDTNMSWAWSELLIFGKNLVFKLNQSLLERDDWDLSSVLVKDQTIAG